MSTRNIPQLAQIRGSLKATAGHVRDRSRAVADELSSLTRDEEDVRVGAAAVLQHIDDERQPLTEEADQLIGILRSALGTPPQDEEQAPADTPPADPPAQPEPPQEQPAQPDAPTAVMPAQPEAQEAINLPQAQDVPARRNVFIVIRDYFSNWSAVSWVTAMIFLAVTLIIMLTAYPGFFPDRPEVMRFIVGFVVLPITFFMIGGWIGSMIDRARARRQTAVEVHQEDAAG